MGTIKKKMQRGGVTPTKKQEYKPDLYNLPNTPDNLKNRYSKTMRATVVGDKFPKGKLRDNALKQDSIAVNNKKFKCGGKAKKKK